MAQQAGTLDRVFNSTFSLPQQFLWRLYRVLEDDKVDLFSEEGILDAALIPVLGVLDDHQHDVMPDYMAKQMGLGDGLGSQLLAAIASDPLTYLTGGATALGKLGKAGSKLSNSPEVAKLLREADLGQMPVSELSDIAQTARGNLLTQGGPKAAKQIKKLDKLSSRFARSLPEAEKLAQAQGIEKLTVQEALKHTRQRQLAIGVPMAASLGLQRDVMPGYNSWWRVFGDGLKSGGQNVTKALHLNALMGAPGVGHLLSAADQLRGGWRVGAEVRYGVEGATAQPSASQIKSMQTWLDAEKGGALISADVDRVINSEPALMSKLMATYEVGIKRNLSAEDAFRRALDSVGIGNSSESGAQRFGRLTGRGADNDFFPEGSWRTLNKGKENIRRIFDNAVRQRNEASAAAQLEGFSAVPKEQLGKKLADVYADKRADMTPVRAAISERAFNTGKTMHEYLNMAFVTGETLKFGKKTYDALLANVARDNDQLQTMTEELFKRINQIAKENPTFSRQEIDNMVLKAMELRGLPEEIQASFKLHEMNPEKLGPTIKAANRFFNRHRRVTNTIEKMLATGGVKDAEMRQKLADLLDDPEHGIFPFLERERKLPDGESSEFLATFDKLIQNESHVRMRYTPDEIKRFRRKHNKYTLRGETLPPSRKGAKERSVLGKLRGRQAGTLSDAEIDSSIAEIEKLAQVKLTADEILEHAAELPAIKQFNRRTKTTVPEALALLKRTGPVPSGQRTLTRGFPLWPKDSYGWTPKQIKKAVEDYGFTLYNEAKTQTKLAEATNIHSVRLSQMEGKELFNLADDGNAYWEANEALSGIVKPGQKVDPKSTQRVIDALNRQAKIRKSELQLKQIELDQALDSGRIKPSSQEYFDASARISDLEYETLYDNSLDIARGLRLGLKELKLAPVTPKLRWYHKQFTDEQLKRKYGIDLKTAITKDGAMAHLREALKGSPKFIEDLGTPTVYRVTKKVKQDRIDDLREVLSEVDRNILLGKTRKFDDTALSANLQADLSTLRELKRRRALPKKHFYHEAGPIVGKRERVVTGVAPPRADYDLFFRQAGVQIPKSAMSEWASVYANGRVLLREVKMALERAQKAGIAPEIDPRILLDLQGNMQRMGDIVVDNIRQAGPKGLGEALDIAENLALASFQAAQRTGTWLPGAPIGYIPRYFNQESRAKLAKIIGDIDDYDGDLLVRIGVKQGEYFARHLDEYSIDDVNSLFAEVRQAANEVASPKLKEFQDRLEDVMRAEGVGLHSVKGAKLPYTGDRVATDPFLSLIQRLGSANQSQNLADYFDTLLETGKQADGSALMLSGKVVGVITDTGRTVPSGSVKKFSGKSVYRGKDGEAVAFNTLTDTNEYTPQAFLIEDSAGKVHRIENDALRETGFGLLSLGDVSRAAEAGVATSPGQQFARASLKSSLHESMFRAPLGAKYAEGLLNNQVVFGSQNVITSAIKASARVHQVAPRFVRTLDSINYMVKSFQTIFSVPFHIANLSSGVFQASLAGASPTNIMAAYMDTLRLLGGRQDYTDHLDMMQTLLGAETKTKSLGIVDLIKGNKPALLRAVRMHGNGELTKFVDELGEQGVSNVEHLILEHADGSSTDLMEFMQLAGEMQLFGTFSSSLTRGSRTIAENLLRTKLLTIDPGLTKIPTKGLNKLRNLAETSEVFNRTATALALHRQGHPMRRAIEIAKEAHVPYEKLTPIEQNYLKRFSVYYTFPRHYMPWAWSRFGEDPRKLARISHFIRDQSLITTQEGKPQLRVGDYRVDVGRLNANFEAAGLVAAFADRVIMPAAEAFVPGVNPHGDMRMVSKAYSDAGITNVGGVLGMILGPEAFSVGDRSSYGAHNLWEDATRIIWPIKLMAQLAGKAPSMEEQSPYVNYTPMEEWLISNRIWGAGIRKVRDKHELIRARSAYSAMTRRLRLRMAATEDEGERESIMKGIQALGVGMEQLIQAEKEVKFK